MAAQRRLQDAEIMGRDTLRILRKLLYFEPNDPDLLLATLVSISSVRGIHLKCLASR